MAKEVNKRVNVWLNQQGIDNNLKSIRAAISKTANELNKLPIGSEEWLRKSEKLSKLKNIYSDVQKETGATSRELDALNKRTTGQIVTVGSLSAAAQAASSVLSRFVSATQEYVDAYATLDDAMTNVSKYTGLTREEVKQLNEEFRKMDTRTPTEKLNALPPMPGDWASPPRRLSRISWRPFFHVPARSRERVYFCRKNKAIMGRAPFPKPPTQKPTCIRCMYFQQKWKSEYSDWSYCDYWHKDTRDGTVGCEKFEER